MAAINVLIHKEGIVPNLELCPLKPERTWANWKQSWNRAWWIFLTVGVSVWPCFCLLSEKGVHFKFMQNLSMFSFRWYLSFLQWLKQTIGFSLIETYRRNDNEKCKFLTDLIANHHTEEERVQGRQQVRRAGECSVVKRLAALAGDLDLMLPTWK